MYETPYRTLNIFVALTTCCDEIIFIKTLLYYQIFTVPKEYQYTILFLKLEREILEKTVKLIGSGGDALTIGEDIVRLDIPAQALNKPTEISVSMISRSSDHPPLGDDKFIISPIVRLEPDGLQFLRPVTISVKHSAVELSYRNLQIWTRSEGRPLNLSRCFFPLQKQVYIKLSLLHIPLVG